MDWKSLISNAFICQLIAMNLLSAQTGLQDQLTAQVGSQYGQKFKVYDCITLDTLIGKKMQSIVRRNELIMDPYSTLRGCSLFAASPTTETENPTGDSVVFGIAKNGQIAWSTLLLECGYWDGIYGTTDLNNDGEVELMTNWSYWWDNDSPEYLWIFRWNGNGCRILNDIDSTTFHSRKPSNIASDGSFQLLQGTSGQKKIRVTWNIDENGKPIHRFQRTNVSTLPFVTYVWNGVHFEIGQEADQVSDKEFLPANLLSVSTKARFGKGPQVNTYSYVWKNSNQSEQNIALVHLNITSGWSSTTQPSDWFSIKNLWGAFGATWILSPRFPVKEDPTLNMIKPGQTVSGFQVISSGLPTIIIYHVQGGTSQPYDLKNQLADGDYLHNLLTNSVTGETIGPLDIPSPFVPLSFLDTISSYTVHCYTLGWITNQTTETKYLGYLSSSKASMQQNNISAVRTILGQVLMDVNEDSTNNLTSEAYALIRYNTEYLLGQLTKAPSGQ